MKQVYLSNVVTLRYTPDKCSGCGRCVEVCPRGVFTLRDGKAAIVARDNCMECGACERNCAFEAITVKNGVGCAVAMINGIITKGNAELGTCGCGGDSSGCC